MSKKQLRAYLANLESQVTELEIALTRANSNVAASPGQDLTIQAVEKLSLMLEKVRRQVEETRDQLREVS